MMKIVSNKKIGDNHQMSKFVARKFLHFGENCGYNLSLAVKKWKYALKPLEQSKV